MPKPVFKDGKPLFKNGKPAFSDSPCDCCGGQASGCAECFGNPQFVTLTIDGFTRWPYTLHNGTRVLPLIGGCTYRTGWTTPAVCPTFFADTIGFSQTVDLSSLFGINASARAVITTHGDLSFPDCVGPNENLIYTHDFSGPNIPCQPQQSDTLTISDASGYGGMTSADPSQCGVNCPASLPAPATCVVAW